MKPSVYILYFEKVNKYYVGSTSDIERRLKQLRSGSTPSTRRYGEEFKLVFRQEFESLATARKIESKIKSWKRRDYIEKIARDQVIKSVGP